MVGRTGAGKTTLFSAILRLTELESGQILIDDIDVSKVELKNLRSNIAGMFFTFTLIKVIVKIVIVQLYKLLQNVKLPTDAHCTPTSCGRTTM